MQSEIPYGRPRHGFLTIGPFRQAWNWPFTKDIGGVLCPRKAGYTLLYDEGVAFGDMLPDSKDDVDERDVCCLKLGGSTLLVLVPVQGGEVQGADLTTPKFGRIGLGKTPWQENEFLSTQRSRQSSCYSLRIRTAHSSSSLGSPSYSFVVSCILLV